MGSAPKPHQTGARRAEIHPYEILPAQSPAQRTEAADHRPPPRKEKQEIWETWLDDGGRETPGRGPG